MFARPRIIIIGGGIARLAAAQLLNANTHCETLILEARNRTGGRIWTLDSWPIPLDLGAFVIHGSVGKVVSPPVIKSNLVALSSKLI